VKINTVFNQQDSLYHDAKVLLGIITTSSDLTSYPLNEFFRSANEWNKQTNTWIMQTEANWKWYDTNNGGALPIQISTITNLKQTTSLPSTALKIEKIEVLDINGNYQIVKPITQREIEEQGYAMSEFYNTPGLPVFYELVGNMIIFYPKPSSSYMTLTNGLKVFFNGTSIAFSLSDTSTKPGFAENFHRIISVGSALDFATSRQMINTINILTPKLSSLKGDLQEFYSTRAKDSNPRIRIYRESSI
jgi:hypothetical protein